MRQLHSRRIATDLAEDVVQKACIVAWRKRQQFLGEPAGNALLSWLRVIARGEIKNLQRSARREEYALGQRNRIEDLLGTPVEPSVVSHCSDTGDSRRFDLVLVLNRALGSLRPKARDLLLRHFFHGIPVRRLAAERRVSVVAIRKRINRSLRRLAFHIRRMVKGISQ